MKISHQPRFELYNLKEDLKGGRPPSLLVQVVLLLTLTLGLFLFTACSTGAGAYIAWRIAPDFPQVKGELRVGDGSSGTRILVDAWGIPHIYARDERELVRALGYMQGRDRRFQLELLSRLASGSIRELIGDQLDAASVLRLDVLSRGVGLVEDARAFLEAAPTQDRAMLAAFAEGVNLATACEPLPLEYRLLGAQPRPWSEMDSALIVGLVAFGLTKNWELEMLRFETLCQGLLRAARLQGAGSTQALNQALDRTLTLWPPARDWQGHIWPTQSAFADADVVKPGYLGRPITEAGLDPELREWLVQEWVPAVLRASPAQGTAVLPGGASSATPRTGGGVGSLLAGVRAATSGAATPRTGSATWLAVPSAGAAAGADPLFIPQLVGQGFASNNWAVSLRSASRTSQGSVGSSTMASGESGNAPSDGGTTKPQAVQALLASDPHLAHMLPSIGYLADLTLEGPDGYQISGASFIGLPGMVFATNGHVAWGVTANWADHADLLVLKDEQGLAERDLEFKIRQNDGTMRSEQFKVRQAPEGVVLNDLFPRLRDADIPIPLLVLKRQRDPGAALSSLRGLYASKSVAEAQQALGDLRAFIGHWVLADAGGNIGYLGSAALPQRAEGRAFLGVLPQPAWTDRATWQGTKLAADLPQVFNPPSGILATANQQTIAPLALDLDINYEGDVPLRWSRIMQVLGQASTEAWSASPEAGLAAMAALQTDSRDNIWPLMKAVVLEALREDQREDSQASQANQTSQAQRSPRLPPQVLKLLETWDGSLGPTTHSAANLFTAFFAQLSRDVLTDELSPATLDAVLKHFNIMPLLMGIVLDPANPAWEGVAEEAATSTGAEEVFATRQKVQILQSLAKVWELLSKKAGSDPQRWPVDLLGQSQFKHAFGNALGEYVNRPLVQAGTINAVNKHNYALNNPFAISTEDGPVLRIAVALGERTFIRAVVPGGQTGIPGHPHYDDQLGPYQRGELIGIERDADLVEKQAVLRITM